MNPSSLSEWLQQAVTHHRAGRLDEAAKLYARVRRAAPKNFDAVHLAGTVAIQQSRMDEALSLLVEARRLNPSSALCAMRQGIALNALQRFAEAETALRDAVKLDPATPDTWFHLGLSLRKLGRIDASIAAYEQALTLSPNYAEAHDRLGALLAGARGHAAAEPHLRRATELLPTLPNGWCNLGVCLIFLGRLGDALACFDQALKIDPKFAHAHAGRGLALSKCYRPAAAIESYGRCLALQPHNHEARSARLYELAHLGNLSREVLFQEHLAFGQAVASANGASGETTKARRPLLPRDRDPDRRLRIGFLSPDLHRHSVTYFLEPLLSHIDVKQFELFLYHDQPIVDTVSERLSRLAAKWQVVAGQSDDQVEAILRRDAPDILIDLAGHTGTNRLPLYARRLAPVQATYLGYPDTTGLAEMDYRLVDAITDPVGEGEKFATEKLLRFASTAWSYAPPADAPDPGGPTATDHLVFGCFNHFAKINDETLRVWGQLMAAAAGSRLLLKGYGLGLPILQADVRRRLAAAGIDPERVDLLERTRTVAEHLQAYSRMHVALDTFPYNGTTTTCEALWMGVPVVTLLGDRHAGRVGGSLLTAIGCPEWIAPDIAQYAEIALRVAEETRSRRFSRTQLRDRMRASALLDHSGQALRFGQALREMWRAECARSVLAA